MTFLTAPLRILTFLWVATGLAARVAFASPVPADTIAPITTITQSPAKPASGWNTTNVVVTFQAADNPGGSGFKEMRTTTNMGAEKVTNQSSWTSTFTASGTTNIAAWSIDLAGNVETTKFFTVRIDKTAPTLTGTVVNRVLTLTATDAHSGVAQVEYSIDGGAFQTYSSPVRLSSTAKVVRAKATDFAGNVSPEKFVFARFVLKAITATPNPVASGSEVAIKVDTLFAAPPGGMTLELSTSSPSILPLPATIVVPAGTATATVRCNAGPVAGDTRVLAGVSTDESVLTTGVVVVLPSPRSITASPSLVVSGDTVTFTLTMNSPAPPGGLVVQLGSFDTSVIAVPSSVTVPAGQTTVTFSAVAKDVVLAKSTLVGASVSDDIVVCTVAVRALSVVSLTFTPSTVLGGTPVQLKVVLNRPLTGLGFNLNLTSTGGGAVIPTHIPVNSGQNEGVLTIQTVAVPTADVTSVQARMNGTNARAMLTVLPPRLSSLTLAPSNPRGGTSSTGTVTLTGPAPAGGMAVKLLSAKPNVAGVPSSITVPAGATTATFTITTIAVTTNTTVAITAVQNMDSKTTNLSVTR